MQLFNCVSAHPSFLHFKFCWSTMAISRCDCSCSCSLLHVQQPWFIAVSGTIVTAYIRNGILLGRIEQANGSRYQIDSASFHWDEGEVSDDFHSVIYESNSKRKSDSFPANHSANASRSWCNGYPVAMSTTAGPQRSIAIEGSTYTKMVLQLI